MHRRHLLAGAAGAAALAALPTLGQTADPWGASAGYPTGWGGGFEKGRTFRVGNYSGGYEQMFKHRSIAAGALVSPLTEALRPDFKYRWGLFQRSPQDYLDQWPVTGLLIARKGNIWHESYRHQRTAAMRLTSWSMAKSVTSLLLGICLDRRLIASYDDPAQRYLPELQGTLHGGVTLRHLSNMSSGAEVLHDRDNAVIYPAAFLGADTDIARTVAGWNQRREDAGRSFNYNELCPLTIGMVIRRVTGQSLSEFAQTALWQPMGAEAAATWLTDSRLNEFNCIGVGARLRDWARLGQLVAQRGNMNGTQVVSTAWIDECTRWSDSDKQVSYGSARQRPALLAGYKAFMWHAKADGSQPVFAGHHGQRVLVDLPTQTVVVQTGVDHEGAWQPELHALFNAAADMKT